MNGFGERSKPWSGDPSTPSEPAYSKDGSWRDLGTSMSAISFGLAATAILISMFLVMAIFEHVIKPRASFLRPRSRSPGASETGQQPPRGGETISIEKLQNSKTVSSSDPVRLGSWLFAGTRANEPSLLAGFRGGRRRPCADAGARVSYLHCPAIAPSLPEGGDPVASP